LEVITINIYKKKKLRSLNLSFPNLLFIYVVDLGSLDQTTYANI